MSHITLRATRCAICNTENGAEELYPANFDSTAFNPVIFSARRLPDRIHYRMVKCSTCGLVRSDPMAEAGDLEKLYRQSTFDYSEEVETLRNSYGRYLRKVGGDPSAQGSLLEVGCGNGFFLEEAIRQGYSDVRGVEPSSQAVSKAPPELRDRIVVDVMRPGLFRDNEFDVVCLFQVFDHLPAPGEVLDECLRVLKPGGSLLVLNHNVESVSARLLRDRSPIIDIEHTYLYSPETLQKLAEKHGFKKLSGGSVWNSYSLQYLARLFPFPDAFKGALLGFLRASHLGKIRMRVPLGNLWMVFRK